MNMGWLFFIATVTLLGWLTALVLFTGLQPWYLLAWLVVLIIAIRKAWKETKKKQYGLK